MNTLSEALLTDIIICWLRSGRPSNDKPGPILINRAKEAALRTCTTFISILCFYRNYTASSYIKSGFFFLTVKHTGPNAPKHEKLWATPQWPRKPFSTWHKGDMAEASFASKARLWMCPLTFKPLHSLQWHVDDTTTKVHIKICFAHHQDRILCFRTCMHDLFL